MSVIIDKTVRELALENAGATRLFEKLGIDYCCGGNRTLEQACHTAHVPVEEALKALEAAPSSSANPPDGKWQTAPLADLIWHITATHHKFTRDEIARLGPLFAKVCSVHGAHHPELRRLQDIFAGLSQELTAHLMKEEMVLFPYIIRMEAAEAEATPILRSPFGSVQNPVAMMEHEHDSAGNALRDMREISGGYAAPPGACLSFQTLYKALAELEADLHHHIHLENNILFPRAVAMEEDH